MQTKTVKKRNSNENVAIATSFSFGDSVADYAGNGKQLPRAYVTVETKASISTDRNIQAVTNVDLSQIIATVSAINNRQSLKVIAENLCKQHPEIDIDPEMLGGMPHIKGVRLSVGNILEKLYVYGSVEKIKEIYKTDISENQIKAAIAYAQDFLENACVSR